MELQDSAERRFLTILHCDLVESTRLVDGLDPEEFLALMEQFLSSAHQVVDSYQAIVAGYTGDGFEAYFGYPVVSESPAADAVSAAIEIVEALEQFNRSAEHTLECRIGIATGLVVIGAAKRIEFGRRVLAFGSTPHLAERLQSVAETGTIVVDNDTRRLACKRFEFTHTGDWRLKGFEDEISAYVVVAPVVTVSRFDYKSAPLTPIIGRQYVLDMLQGRWNAVLEGEGQLVFLYGEAGMGKSRSIYEFEKLIEDQVFVTYRFQCSNQHTSTPLHPWLHYLIDRAQFQPDDTLEVRRGKLQQVLGGELNLSPEHQDLCATLLGVTEKHDQTPVVAAPGNMLSTLQTSLIDHVVRRAQDGPILVIVEDEQWIDATSELGLTELVDRSLQIPVLVCVTGRPGSQSITKYPHVTTLSLTRLIRSEVRLMVSEIASSLNQDINPALVEKIVDKCDGNPLYIEEISSMCLVQSSNSEDTTLDFQRTGINQIPLTLQASLLARVDRIETGKDIAQLAAVIARSFDETLLRDTGVLSDMEISTGLDELVQSNILTCTEKENNRVYDFRHALIRDAIYESLLNDRKKRFHAVIADCYVANSDSNSSLRPELIAQHYDRADNWQQAFSLWVSAGEQTLRSGATHESVSQLTAALKYESLAEQDESMHHDLLRMHMACGIALNALGGVGADPYRHFHRASELATSAGDQTHAAMALDWQFGVDFNAGNLVRSKNSAQSLRELGIRNHHSIAYIAGSQALGMVNFALGRFETAEEIFLDLLGEKNSIVSDVHCYPSMSLSYLAWAQYALGKYDSARKSALSAIDSAQYESPHSMTTALSNCSYVFQCLGEHRRVVTYTEQLLKHCNKYGEYMYGIRGKFMQCWLDSFHSKNEAVLTDMREYLSLLIEAKEEIEMTYLLGLMTETEHRLGRNSDASRTLEKAYSMVQKNNEQFNVRELDRLRDSIESANRYESVT